MVTVELEPAAPSEGKAERSQPAGAAAQRAATPERMLAAGSASLAEVELLAILMGTRDLTPAALLLDRFGGLGGLERAGLRQLASAPAMDAERACRIHAALALGRRLVAPRPLPGQPIRTAAEVWLACAAGLALERRELFLALALDCRHRLQAQVLVATGTLSAVDVEPREAFRFLVQESAHAVIFVHNHPSGDPTPSRADRLISERLADVGRLLGIQVLDHVVVGAEGYASALHGGPVMPPPRAAKPLREVRT